MKTLVLSGITGEFKLDGVPLDAPVEVTFHKKLGILITPPEFLPTNVFVRGYELSLQGEKVIMKTASRLSYELLDAQKLGEGLRMSSRKIEHREYVWYQLVVNGSFIGLTGVQQ